MDGPFLFLVCIYGVFFSVACYHVAKAKGYDAVGGAVWGFLFGLLGLIVYAILPVKKEKTK